MKKALIALAMVMVAACGGPTYSQSYYICYSQGSVSFATFGDHPRPKASATPVAGQEEYCSDEALTANGYVKDPNAPGGWRKK